MTVGTPIISQNVLIVASGMSFEKAWPEEANKQHQFDSGTLNFDTKPIVEVMDGHGVWDYQLSKAMNGAERRSGSDAAVAVLSPQQEGGDERHVLGKSRGKIRRWNNDNEGLVKDIPPAKRQATPCKLRPRGNNSRTEKLGTTSGEG
ncbi:hypothetical protein B0H13DRAFT_1873059 [Mycena leptocephala]|nr:hypothetical protein B0H13DRAFT_1873059 [Mycena leptocephala]